MRPRFASRMALPGLGLATVLAAGTFVMAQTPAPPAAVTEEQRLRAERLAERQAVREAERVARLEAAIVYLRERLQITAAQDPLWSVFAQSLRADAAARTQAAAAAPAATPGPLPLSQRLARRQADLTARSERVGAVMRTLNPLYAALSVEQKAVADRLVGTSEDGRLVIRRDRDDDDDDDD
jgi:periplasmic protein CpxP/Spy